MRRILAVLVPVLLVACSTGEDARRPAAAIPTSKSTPPGEVKPEPIADCAAWRRYFTDALAREFLTVPWLEPCWGCETFTTDGGDSVAVSAADEGAFADPEAAPVAPSTATLSDTNVQEAGVDEADLVEADPDSGRFYLARRFPAELLVARAVPPETLSVVARLSLDASWVHGLYLDAARDRLVVVTERAGFWSAAPEADSSVDRPQVELRFYALDDPDAPSLQAGYAVDGSLVGTRRIGDRVHLVTRFRPWLPALLREDQEFFDLVYARYPRARQQANHRDERVLAAAIRQRVAEAVDAAELGDLLPRWRLGGATPAQPLDCTAVHAPRVEHRLGLVTVSSVDTDGTDLAHAAIVNNAWQMYASPDHLYLVQTSGGWWFDEAQTQQTALLRLAWSADGPAGPDAHGVIDGWPRSSNSFSEHDGVLRAVTTEGRFTPEAGWRTANHLFTLAADESGALAELGSVRDFEPGESVFAARFLGERGYVVTFERIDPLLTFDLSDPAAPRIAGLLELPGFSTYLHPFGEDHLVALGREATPDGFLTGQLALQLFDVSVLESPQLVQRRLIPAQAGDGWTWSPAEHDPHAFTLADGLLSIPVQRWGSTAQASFSGFLAYTVDPTRFTPRGAVDHAIDDDGSGDCPPPARDAPSDCASFAPVLHSVPLRSVIGGEAGEPSVLYTLSDRFLKANTADDLAPIATVDLSE